MYTDRLQDQHKTTGLTMRREFKKRREVSGEKNGANERKKHQTST